MRGFRGRLLAPALLAALLATGCKDPAGGTTVSVKPAFLPVTFTIDSSGNISVSAEASIVTPLGEVSVSGFQHELGNPKPYLVAAIRHLKRGTASGANAAAHRTTVYSMYRIGAKDRHVRPALNGQPLALAQRGTIVVDATHTQPGRVTELQIADAPEQQHSPVPTSTASSCAGTDSIGVTLPEVSAGAEVTDTVAELAADCLQVQYAAEPVDGVAEGTVSRVVIPVDGPADAVRLPPADKSAPGPGDRVTASRRTPATVYVAAPAPTPSSSPPPSGGGEPSGQVSDESSATAVPGTRPVEGARTRPYARARARPGNGPVTSSRAASTRHCA